MKTFIMLIQLLILTSYGDVAKGTKIACPYTEQHITINGYLDEWADLIGLRVNTFEDTNTNRAAIFNNKARFSARWNENSLYLAFYVQDRNLNSSTFSDLDNARQDDGIEIWIDGANDSGIKINENDYHLVVGLNNNVNEMRGREKSEAAKEKVPRVMTRHLKLQTYVRTFGTINDNADIDSGYSVEMAIDWKSLGVNPILQRAIRIDVGVLDLDTNAFSTPETWRPPYYSGFMLCDKEYDRSPSLWALLQLSEPPIITENSDSEVSNSVPLKTIIIIILILLVSLIIFIFFYLRIRKLQRELRNQILNKLQQYLEGHYKEKISLDDFSKLHNYTESQVQKVFKGHYKSSFANVLLQKRMEEAKRQLESTDKNVTEVCFEVGFNDASYFTKSFKNFFKILPKEVKKKRPDA
ncbi:MAG: helix-turn-helix domain-containing protein [Fibrobacteres bacterium]|nr:helix-turn-helix domain-containing protein [Fibrobacterota bacterium]